MTIGFGGVYDGITTEDNKIRQEKTKKHHHKLYYDAVNDKFSLAAFIPMASPHRG